MIFTCLFLFCYIIYQKFFDNFDSVVSNLDGKAYSVRSNLSPTDKLHNANFLAIISNKIDKLVWYKKL